MSLPARTSPLRIMIFNHRKILLIFKCFGEFTVCNIGVIHCLWSIKGIPVFWRISALHPFKDRVQVKILTIVHKSLRDLRLPRPGHPPSSGLSFHLSHYSLCSSRIGWFALPWTGKGIPERSNTCCFFSLEHSSPEISMWLAPLLLQVTTST